MMNVKYQDFPNSCKGRGGDSKFLLRAGAGGFNRVKETLGGGILTIRTFFKP